MKKLLFFLFATTMAHAQQYVWTQRASLPASPRHEAMAFSIGSKGYFGTGMNSILSSTFNDLWEYDEPTNTWTQKANMPGPSRYGAAAFSIGSLGYVGTGWTNSGVQLKDFYEYNPATNQWTAKADFAGAKRVVAPALAPPSSK